MVSLAVRRPTPVGHGGHAGGPARHGSARHGSARHGSANQGSAANAVTGLGRATPAEEPYQRA